MRIWCWERRCPRLFDATTATKHETAGYELWPEQRRRRLVNEYECEFPFHYANVTVIRRFREDRESGLFLSLESGGVGLNLQAADTVINMDQPWNPARLEQRVARAWRISPGRSRSSTW